MMDPAALDSPLFALNQAVSLAFVVDMGINFNLAYVDKSTYELVQDRLRIRWHYLSSSWFWLDLVSVVPFDIIALYMEKRVENDDEAGSNGGGGGGGVGGEQELLGVGRSLRLCGCCGS